MIFCRFVNDTFNRNTILGAEEALTPAQLSGMTSYQLASNK